MKCSFCKEESKKYFLSVTEGSNNINLCVRCATAMLDMLKILVTAMEIEDDERS
jgi:hypothetical protein